MFNKIGIIGAGNIGSSLAHNLILYNREVVLVDISEEILNKSRHNIEKDLRFAHMYLKTKKFDKALIHNIKFSIDINDVKNCNFVVENTPEKWGTKEKVYKQLNTICGEDTVFGVNTSCISITKVAALTKCPERVIGIHLMNPVYLKNCTEVIRGYHTTDETVQKVENFLSQINKRAVVVQDFPGFVSNRVSHLFMNEAMYVVQDKVATPAQVDEIFKSCFGHMMGPLETADLIGLDTVLNSLIVLYESYYDSKYRPCPLLQKMVDAGCLGMKSGEGFYQYNI